MGLKYPQEFLDSLFLQQEKTLYTKVDILDWQENVIGDIQGKTESGNLTIEGSSAIRRTCSLSMIVDEDNYNITSLKNEVALNKKAKVYMGVSNGLYNYSQYGPVIWFPLGVFVLTESSIIHNTTSNSLSITAQDKMCLLSGDVGGQLQSPTELWREFYYNVDTGKTEARELRIFDIIKYAVAGLGEEIEGKIMINDVPLQTKRPLKYIGNVNKYFDVNNNELKGIEDPDSDDRIYRVLRPGEYAGYKYEDLTCPTQLTKQAGDTVVSILSDIVSALGGNYEFFYDVDGNFIFQEIKNYVNTTFTPLRELSNGSYIADFSKVPNVYSFKDKGLIQTYSNNPDWKNIKNDFVVWGTRQNSEGKDAAVIQYHLAIDEKPVLPPGYEKPWQQYLVEKGDKNPQDGGRYYQELKAKLPLIYNAENNKWNDDPSSYNYYFDLITADSELGKFSVSNIGRRTKAITDSNVTQLYPAEIPDIVIYPVGIDSEIIDHMLAIGQTFQLVNSNEYSTLYKEGSTGKDAFTVIRDMLYKNTSFGEAITMTGVPLYFLDVNQRVEVEDKEADIKGDYIIKTMNLPLSVDGLMSLTALRVSSRI